VRNIGLRRHEFCVSDRFRRASITTLSNGALSCLRAIVSFVTVSLLVGYLGRESYGLCATITGMASWLSVTQGGVGQSLKNDMIREPESAGAVFSDAFAYLAGIVLTAGILFTTAAWFLPWKAILNAPAFSQIPLIVASLWIALLTALFGLVRATFAAFQTEFKLAPALVAGVAISFGLVVTGIHRGWSTAAVVSASLAGNVLGLAFGLFAMPVRLSWPTGLYRAGLWFFVIEACTILIFEADIFLVNLMLGAGTAAVFALHAQLFVYVQTGIALVVSPYWAAFGEAWHSGDKEWLKAGVRRLTAATALLSVAGVGLVLMAGRPLMSRWSHGQVEWNPALALLIGMNVAIQGVTSVYATALGAMGIARSPARVIVFQAALNIAVCVWAIRRFGVTGVAAGSLITYAATSGLYLPWKVKQVTA
jgi:O-antigen/teichoic acid export membrane protein